MSRLPPIYFPTSVLVLDDEYDFLVNLTLLLDDRLAYRIYDSAHAAIAWIETHKRLHHGWVHRYYSFAKDRNSLSLGPKHAVLLELSRMYKEVYNPNRFEEISVVVVDYLMPEMNGLEFCRQIRKHGIKTILLTGRADERVAVQAFNEGLIDRFLFKNDAEIDRRLNRAIQELQEAYLREKFSCLIDAMSGQTLSYLADPQFSMYFAELMREQHCVEYYLLDQPHSFLLLDEQGRPSLMLLASDQDLTAHYLVAKDEQAPVELLKILLERSHIPFFHIGDGYYQHGYQAWRSDLHAAKVFVGTCVLYYALVRNPQMSWLQTGAIRSYRDFLSELDKEDGKGRMVAG